MILIYKFRKSKKSSWNKKRSAQNKRRRSTRRPMSTLGPSFSRSDDERAKFELLRD